MSWERVEALPGAAGGGGAFRAGAEPVVAERRGVRLVERLWLFWHSSPEHPLGRVAERVVVTPTHVYVDRRDGVKARARLEQLHGERLDHRRVVYGVRDGDDLLLSYRAECPVQVRLSAAVRGAEPVTPWRDTQWLMTYLVLGTLAIGFGGALLASYPLEYAIEHVGMGFYTSETVLGTLGAFGALLFGLLLFAWGPSRWRIDAVAVTRTRGVLPWLTFSIPPEAVRRAFLRPGLTKPKHGRAYQSGWWVGIELCEPTRIGSVLRMHRLDLDYFSFGLGSPPSQEAKDAEHLRARALAERLRGLLALGPVAELKRHGR